MAQIKETIDLLLIILRENGFSRIRAEIFRQAKFDQPEATPSFWRLLLEAIYFVKNKGIDTVGMQCFSTLEVPEIVSTVKKELLIFGFTSEDFDMLPLDMSQGSRELLIAFGWLICSKDLIRLMMDLCSKSVDEEYMIKQTYNLDVTCDNKSVFPLPSLDSEDKIQRLLWLNHKFQMNLRELHALKYENDRLLSQINKSNYIPPGMQTERHLSLLEMNLLQHPELLRKIIHLLETDSKRLRNLISWKSKETLFWKWMDSVVELKESECKVKEHYQPSQVVEQIARENYDDLQQAIKKYSVTVCYLEAMMKQSEHNLTSMELDIVSSALDSEIERQLEKLRGLFLLSPRKWVLTPKHASKEPRKILDAISEVESRLKLVEDDMLTGEAKAKSILSKILL